MQRLSYTMEGKYQDVMSQQRHDIDAMLQNLIKFTVLPKKFPQILGYHIYMSRK